MIDSSSCLYRRQNIFKVKISAMAVLWLEGGGVGAYLLYLIPKELMTISGFAIGVVRFTFIAGKVKPSPCPGTTDSGSRRRG